MVNRYRSSITLCLVLLVLLITASSVFAQDPAPTTKPASAVNPDLAAACGIDLILVLDESGSITSTNANLVRSAALAFANALANTGSRMAVVEFSSFARRPFNYTLVTSGWITTAFTPYINATAPGADTTNRYNPAEPAPGGNLTNWDDALEEARLINNTSVAPLVVFVTDGIPNTYNLDAPGEPGGIPSGTTNPQTLWRAILEANKIKDQGSHLLGVGLGLSVTGLLNLQDVTGPELAPPAAFNIATTDIVAVGDFTTLANQLRAVVTELCGSSVNIVKRVDEGDGHGPMPSAGWQFTVSVQIQVGGSYQWITPLPSTPQTPRSASTNVNGAVTFQWDPRGDFSSKATIIEALKPGYVFDSVVCNILRENGFVQPVTMTVNTATPGQVALVMPLALSIGPKDSMSCEITNKAIPPKLTIIKNVDGGPAQPDDFKLTVGQLPVQSGVANILMTNTPYAIGETQLPNYEFVSITGHAKCPAVLNGTIMLSAGDDITCTITNRFTGPTTGGLTVIKLVEGGSAAPGDFNIKVTVGGAEQPNFPGDSSGTTLSGLAGGAAYSVEETNPGSYTPEYSAGCAGTIVVGQTQTCTITNRLPQTGDLKVIKIVSGGPAVPGDFNIKVNVGGAEQQFAGQGDPGTLLSGLPNGASYSVVETNPGSYLPSYDAGCVGTIVGGQTQTCTITNTHNPQDGTLTVKKVVVGGPAQPGDFQLQVTIGGGAPINFPGKAEGEVFNGAHGLSFNVTEPAPGADYVVSYQNCAGTFVVGQNQECIVTNTYNPPPPVCTPQDRDPKAHLTGTIVVQGDMLVGTITNSSPLCEYEVGMAAYQKADNNLTNQILFSWDPGAIDPNSFLGGSGQPTYPAQSKVVPPNSTITLAVQMPSCATQVDLFFDANHLSVYGMTNLDSVPLVLPAFNTGLYGPHGQKYDMRLILALHFGDNNFCVPAAPDPNGGTTGN